MLFSENSDKKARKPLTFYNNWAIINKKIAIEIKFSLKIVHGGRDLKKKQVLFLGVFVIYCFALIYVLFLDGRGKIYDMPLLEYIKCSVNFVPFRTISNYMNNIHTGMINIDTILYNLIGNFLLFFPMGFLLPITFKRLDTLFKCIIIVFSSILLVEILQLTLQIGIFDIDDFILNLLGGFIGYAMSRIRLIRKLCMDSK